VRVLLQVSIDMNHVISEGAKGVHNDFSGPNLHPSDRRVCIASRWYSYEEQMGHKCSPN